MSSIFLYCLIAIFSYINMVWIYGIVSKQKFKIKFWYLILIIVISILNSYISYTLPVYFKTIYNLVCYFLLTKLIYKNEVKYWIFNSLIVWGSGTLLDIGFMSLSSLLFKKFIAKFPILSITILTTILQIIYNFIFRIMYLQRVLDKISNKIKEIENIYWFYCVVIVLLVIFSLLSFSNLDVFTNEIKILFLVLVCISISVYFILFIYIEKTYNETSKNLLENNVYYVDLNTKNRIFKHNIIHKLDSVKTVANDKSKKLLDDLIEEYNLTSSSSKEIDNLPNGINGLICQKIYSSRSKKVDFAINNYIKSELFDVLTPKKYNKLCETLGICLDNAISATLKTKEKILQIAILENQDNIFIKIVNTFKSELEIDEIGNLNYTTKNNGHGLGLYSIFSRKDVRIKTSIINNLFENQIIVKKNKIKA